MSVRWKWLRFGYNFNTLILVHHQWTVYRSIILLFQLLNLFCHFLFFKSNKSIGWIISNRSQLYTIFSQATTISLPFLSKTTQLLCEIYSTILWFSIIFIQCWLKMLVFMSMKEWEIEVSTLLFACYWFCVNL